MSVLSLPEVKAMWTQAQVKQVVVGEGPAWKAAHGGP